MEHKGTIRIETERLILRPFALEDAPAAFRNWMHDARVTKYLRWTPHLAISETETTLRRWIEQYAQPDFYQWAIVPKDLGEPVGTISVVDQEERAAKLHIGYCIGVPWWGKGYTAEAFAALIPFFFDEVGAGRIEAQHDPKNPNSGRVMRKAGLRHEATLRKADWNNTGIVDAELYALLAEEYRLQREKKNP